MYCFRGTLQSLCLTRNGPGPVGVTTSIRWGSGLVPCIVPARNSVSLGIVDLFSFVSVTCTACEQFSFPCSGPSSISCTAELPCISRSSRSVSSSPSSTTAAPNAPTYGPSTASSGPVCPSCGQAGGILSLSSSLTPWLPGPARASDCSGPGSPAEAGMAGPLWPGRSAISSAQRAWSIPSGAHPAFTASYSSSASTSRSPPSPSTWCDTASRPHRPGTLSWPTMSTI